MKQAIVTLLIVRSISNTFSLKSITDIDTGKTVYFNQLPECEAAFQAWKNRFDNFEKVFLASGK